MLELKDSDSFSRCAILPSVILRVRCQTIREEETASISHSHTTFFVQEQCMLGYAEQPERIFASGTKLIESMEAARRPATAAHDIDDAAVYHQVMAHLQKDTFKAAHIQQEVAGSHHHAAKVSSAPAEGAGQEEHTHDGLRSEKEPLSGILEESEPAVSLAMRSPAVTSEGSGPSGDWEVMFDVSDDESEISSFDDSSIGSPRSPTATATSQVDSASLQDTLASPSLSASTITILASPAASAMDDSCASSPVSLAAATVITDDFFCPPSAAKSSAAATPSGSATSAVASPLMAVPPNSPALSATSDGTFPSPPMTAWDVSRVVSFISPDTQPQQAAECEAAELHEAETASDTLGDAAKETASHSETDVADVEAGVGGSELSALSGSPAAVGAPGNLTEAVHPSADAICNTVAGLSSQEDEAGMPVLVSSDSTAERPARELKMALPCADLVTELADSPSSHANTDNTHIPAVAEHDTGTTVTVTTPLGGPCSSAAPLPASSQEHAESPAQTAAVDSQSCEQVSASAPVGQALEQAQAESFSMPAGLLKGTPLGRVLVMQTPATMAAESSTGTPFFSPVEYTADCPKTPAPSSAQPVEASAFPIQGDGQYKLHPALFRLAQNHA